MEAVIQFSTRIFNKPKIFSIFHTLLIFFSFNSRQCNFTSAFNISIHTSLQKRLALISHNDQIHSFNNWLQQSVNWLKANDQTTGRIISEKYKIMFWGN